MKGAYKIEIKYFRLCSNFEGRNAYDAFNHSITLAQTAEQLGYTRYWVAEHHNVFSVASSAPEIVMMMLLEQTQTIKIGSGGVMLPLQCLQSGRTI